MHIDVAHPAQNTSVLTVHGELDLATADDLRAALRAATEDSEHVVLDLGQIEFLDSRGMRAIAITAREAGRANVSFQIACVEENRNIRRVLTLLGIDRVSPIHNTVDDALAATATSGS